MQVATPPTSIAILLEKGTSKHNNSHPFLLRLPKQAARRCSGSATRRTG